MANTLRPYVECVRSTLRAALCLQAFPCQQVERQSKPEVEAQAHPELLRRPLLICRNSAEKVLVESSVNSVRVSIKVKQVDQADEYIASTFLRFLMQRADSIGIMRKKPLDGYDVSFLVTASHLEETPKERIIAFICDEFLADIDAQVSDFKLAITARGRAVGAELLKVLTP